jgi:hypothetical protein
MIQCNEITDESAHHMQKEASGKVIITHGQMGPEKCPLI